MTGKAYSTLLYLHVDSRLNMLKISDNLKSKTKPTMVFITHFEPAFLFQLNRVQHHFKFKMPYKFDSCQKLTKRLGYLIDMIDVTFALNHPITETAMRV